MNLQAYKFDTKVLENGIISIPEFKDFVNQEIEIFIVLKQPSKQVKKITADDFINKWAGFLTLASTDDVKYQYLNEKYK